MKFVTYAIHTLALVVTLSCGPQAYASQKSDTSQKNTNTLKSSEIKRSKEASDFEKDALFKAIRSNTTEDNEYLKWCLKTGTKVNYAIHGITPLLWAVQKGNLAALRYMLKEQSEIEDQDKRNCFLYAANKGDYSSAYQLYKHGTPIDATDDKGYNIVHFAVEHTAKDHTDQTMLLGIFNWKDISSLINKQAKNGYTPFMLATHYFDDSTCQLLYAEGANPTIEDCGTSAFSIANKWAADKIKQKMNQNRINELFSFPTRILEMVVEYPIKEELAKYINDNMVRNLIAAYACERAKSNS